MIQLIQYSFWTGAVFDDEKRKEVIIETYHDFEIYFIDHQFKRACIACVIIEQIWSSLTTTICLFPG